MKNDFSERYTDISSNYYPYFHNKAERICYTNMNKSLKLKRSAKIVLASILAAMTLISYSSCSSNNGGNIGSADTSDETTDTLTGASSSKSDDEEPGKELKPTGEVDSDAEEIEGIAIRSAADLSKIGKSAKYPTSGNYVLVADIDLSSYGTFTPIAGSVSECGIVKGSNVFSGTFDGRGHTITGLSINVSSEERVHVGLFGSVGSSKKNSPAVEKKTPPP